MKELIFAIISVCLSTGECERHQMRVEAKVCKLGTVTAQVPHGGEWRDATVTFKC